MGKKPITRNQSKMPVN